MPSKARYYSLRGAKTLLERGPEAPLGKKDISWEEQLSRTRSFVESAMRDVARGYFPPIPDERLEACNYCDFASLCRVSRPRIVAKIAANRKAARLAKTGIGQTVRSSTPLENADPEQDRP
jgi:hypothetical protein